MDQDMRMLLRAAQAAPSADNSQPWCFSLGERSFSVAFDAERGASAFFGPGSPATLLAVGALAEHVMETADQLGIEAQIDNLVDSPTVGFPYLTVHLTQPPEKKLPEEPTVFARHTNRLPFQSHAIDGETLRTLSSLQEAPARLSVTSDREQIKKIAKLVSLASEIRFQIKEVHLWLMESLRFSEEDIARGDGLDVNTLLLPPGGKAFLQFVSDWKRMEAFNRFGTYKFLAKEEAKLVRKAPALVAVIAPTHNPGLFSSGQLMARAWTLLNTKQVAVHPYFAISDQLNRLQEELIPPKLIAKVKDLHEACKQVFGYDEAESLHMLLRVGYPKAEPVRSRRLPLDALIKESTSP